MFKAAFGPESARRIKEEGGTPSEENLRHAFESRGGRLLDVYFAFGDVDMYVIGELPDYETAAALSLAVNVNAGISLDTVVLFTPEEIDQAAKGIGDF
jgi:uncharacterized protein with GYD domain